MSGKKRILIVDDDSYSVILIKEYLKPLQTEIFNVRNGKLAVDFCKNHSVNLVITDILMPVMDGIEELKKLRKINPNLAVVAETAYATREKLDEIVNVGFDAVITKPFLKEDFFNVISRLLQKTDDIIHG